MHLPTYMCYLCVVCDGSGSILKSNGSRAPNSPQFLLTHVLHIHAHHINQSIIPSFHTHRFEGVFPAHWRVPHSLLMAFLQQTRQCILETLEGAYARVSICIHSRVGRWIPCVTSRVCLYTIHIETLTHQTPHHPTPIHNPQQQFHQTHHPTTTPPSPNTNQPSHNNNTPPPTIPQSQPAGPRWRRWRCCCGRCRRRSSSNGRCSRASSRRRSLQVVVVALDYILMCIRVYVCAFICGCVPPL